MNSSAELDKLADALSAAQGKLEDAAKTSSNPHFKSKYADLATVLQTIRPVLSEYGLALVQGASYNHETHVVTVDTRLVHKSGQWVETSIGMTSQKTDAQGVGSCITYGRRYGAAAVVGIAQDDDDGETAVGRGKGAAKTTPTAGLVDTAALIKQLEGVKTSLELAGLAGSFAQLTDAQKAEVMPVVAKAKTRVKATSATLD